VRWKRKLEAGRTSRRVTASAPSSPKAGRPLTWEEMQRYWQIHAARCSTLDWEVDPERLANVCQPGQPHWLNEYYARSQRLVFERLLALVPPPGPGSRALDIGCGAGRWTRLLAACGYITTGIDIQSRLIELNRERFPAIEFEDEALQESFDTGVETLLIGTNLAQGATHCGFLFRAGPVAGSAWHQP